MRLAKSYSGYTFDETKAYEKGGKLYVNATCKCDRCVKGVFVCRVENGQPVPHPNYGGVCLKCGGTGVLYKEVRLYTDKEYEKMEAANAKTRERKENERLERMKAEYQENKVKSFAENCFNSDEVTYIYFPEDSYDKKEELKAAGFRFSRELMWHIAECPAEFQANCISLDLSEVAEVSAWGKIMYKPEVKDIVKDKLLNARPVPDFQSDWVGEEKQRLRNIPCTLVSIREIETKFGLTQLVKFVTEDGNTLNWWTAVNIPADPGDNVTIDFTIKKHDEYKGEKITVITRAKFI